MSLFEKTFSWLAVPLYIAFSLLPIFSIYFVFVKFGFFIGLLWISIGLPLAMAFLYFSVLKISESLYFIKNLITNKILNNRSYNSLEDVHMDNKEKSKMNITQDNIVDISNNDNIKEPDKIEKSDIYSESLAGVGGWLLLLCILLTIIQPAFAIFTLSVSYNEVSQYYALFPGLKSNYELTIMIAVIMGILSIRAGIYLWQKLPEAVEVAKNYLKLNLFVSIAVAFLPFTAGLPSEMNSFLMSNTIYSIFGALVFFFLWHTYLNRSKRVKATYIENQLSEEIPKEKTIRPEPEVSRIVQEQEIDQNININDNRIEAGEEEVMNQEYKEIIVNTDKSNPKSIGKVILLVISGLVSLFFIFIAVISGNDVERFIFILFSLIPFGYVSGIYWLKSRYESEQLKKVLFFIALLIGVITFIIPLSDNKLKNVSDFFGAFFLCAIPFAIVYAIYWFETPEKTSIENTNNFNSKNNANHINDEDVTIRQSILKSDYLSSIGKYNIISEIGKGGMGTVYLALDPQLNRQVALKVIPQNIYFNTDFTNLFKREINILASLEHPAIVPIYNADEENGRLYYTMKYIKGENLEDYLKMKQEFGSLEIKNLILQLCDALDYAHKKKILHRDLKPSNIMLDVFHKAYILDFGISKILNEDSELTKSRQITGTPFYMPPEAFTGKGVDNRSDLYSLGIIIYQLVTGQLPFDGDLTTVMYKHVHEAANLDIIDTNKISPEFKTIIAKLLEKDKEKRYNDALELKKQIE